MSLRQDRVRLLCFIKRQPNLTFEEFDHHWLDVHRELFTSIEPVKKNILKYEQLHINEEGLKQAGINVDGLNWDGIALFEAETFEKFQEVFNSTEYKTIVYPDECYLMDRAKTLTVPIGVGTFIDKTE